MFLIKTRDLALRLEMAPVESLLLHEEVIPEHANDLVLEFRNWANLQNPVIVDENLMVLDGHHRAFVFKKLRFNYISVCRIDYFNQAVKLRYWFRLLDGIGGRDRLSGLIEAMGGRLHRVADGRELEGALDGNRLAFGIQHGNLFAWVSFREGLVGDAVGAYSLVEKIQEEVLRIGGGLEYIPCHTVQKEGFSAGLKADQVILWTPRISKEMVVDAVRRGKVFSPKATRHLIPARPLNVNVPITMFREGICLSEINERFTEFLKKKGLRRFAPGQIIDGRYYEEELFVFYS